MNLNSGDYENGQFMFRIRGKGANYARGLIFSVGLKLTWWMITVPCQCQDFICRRVVQALWHRPQPGRVEDCIDKEVS